MKNNDMKKPRTNKTNLTEEQNKVNAGDEIRTQRHNTA